MIGFSGRAGIAQWHAMIGWNVVHKLVGFKSHFAEPVSNLAAFAPKSAELLRRLVELVQIWSKPTQVGSKSRRSW